jgi:hypothetical protein
MEEFDKYGVKRQEETNEKENEKGESPSKKAGEGPTSKKDDEEVKGAPTQEGGTEDQNGEEGIRILSKEEAGFDEIEN